MENGYLTVNFSEPVSGFSPSDLQITVDNGTINRGGWYYFEDNEMTWDGSYDQYAQWLYDWNPMDGTIKIEIAEGAAKSAKDGTLTNAFSYTSDYIDTVKPEYSVKRSPYTNFSNTDRVYTFEFNESVKGFTKDVISDSKYNPVNLAVDLQVIEEGFKYEATVKAPEEEYRGNLGITIDFSSVKDLAGNSVQMPSRQEINRQWDVTGSGSEITYLSAYDTERPSPTLEWAQEVNNKNTILSDSNKYGFFRLKHKNYNDSSMKGLTRSDWIVKGAIINNSNSTTGSLIANDDEEGILSIFLPEGSYTDNSGNPNKRSNTIYMEYDRKNPELVSTSKTFDPITGIASYSLDFSEKVTDLSKDTVSIYDVASLPNRYIGNRKITSEYTSSLDGTTKTIHYKPLSVVDNSQIDKVNVSGSFWNTPRITDQVGNMLSQGSLYETFNPLESQE
jgi:hypothetical protein